MSESLTPKVPELSTSTGVAENASEPTVVDPIVSHESDETTDAPDTSSAVNSLPVSTLSNETSGDTSAIGGENISINQPESRDTSQFVCNICLNPAKYAVITFCGHLFCWYCLYDWFEMRPDEEVRPAEKLCPVCRSPIDKDRVIPVYGRNSNRQRQPRNGYPQRPAAQRIQPARNFGFGDFGLMSFGIGAFSFGYFASTLQFEPNAPNAIINTVSYSITPLEEEQQMCRIFVFLALLFISWLVLPWMVDW